MIQLAIVVAWCLSFGASISAHAVEIFVSYAGDVPSYSSQPYDRSYRPVSSPDSTHRQPVHQASRKRIADTSSPHRSAIVSTIHKIAQRYGLDPRLLLAIAEVESGLNADAVSPKGAIGIMQLLPQTASRYGVSNPYDVEENLDGGARHLRDLLLEHQGNIPLTLSAYNAGKSNVVRHNRRIPPFRETMLYVPQVMARVAALQLDTEDWNP